MLRGESKIILMQGGLRLPLRVVRVMLLCDVARISESLVNYGNWCAVMRLIVGIQGL